MGVKTPSAGGDGDGGGEIVVLVRGGDARAS